MTTVTTTTEQTNLNTYVSKNTLQNFKNGLYFYDMGEKAIWQDGSYKIQWLKFNKLSLTHSSAQLSEGSTPTEQNFGATSVVVTPKQFGEYVTLSDMLLDTDPISYLDGASIEIADNMARIVDDYIQDTIDAGTNVLYAGSATSRATVAGTDKFTASMLNKARAKLEAAGIPKVDGFYVAIMHPLVYHDLLAETGTGSFIEVAKYAAPEKLFKGEVGAFFGIRIVVSGNVKYYTDAGATGTDVYPTYIMGRQAYGVPMLKEVTTFVTPRNSTDSDPLAQRVKVGAKVAFNCAVLNESALWRVESSSSLGA